MLSLCYSLLCKPVISASSYDTSNMYCSNQVWNKVTQRKVGSRKTFLYGCFDNLLVFVISPSSTDRYPDYHFLTSHKHIFYAQKKNRYTIEGAQAIIQDVVFLRECNFVLGTLSSNVNRFLSCAFESFVTSTV